MKPIRRTSQFKKDIRCVQKRGYDLDKLKRVIEKLACDEPLEEQYEDHAPAHARLRPLHHFIKPRTLNSGTEFKVIFPLSGVLLSRFKRKRLLVCRLNPRRRPLRPRSEKTTPA